MATAASKDIKDFVFEWEGKDRHGKIVRGEIRAVGENQVQATLRRQGVLPTKIKKRRMRAGKKIKPKDIALFTRQMATMMKAGVPLLQAFDIVGRGNANASVTKLLNDIRSDVETGTSLNAAFRKYPMYFNSLYCNLVEAGEAAGILETLLDRLAAYRDADVICFDHGNAREMAQLMATPLWRAMPFVRAGRFQRVPAVWFYGATLSAMHFARVLADAQGGPA